jgi:hypothetical protein
MTKQTDRPRPHGDPLKDEVVNNPEENGAQRDSDAPADATVQRRSDRRNDSDRANGRGSDANGVPEFDEAAGEQRRRLYDEGADLVSRID